MKSKTRKLLATLLALAMVFSMMVAIPVVASADTPPGLSDICAIWVDGGISDIGYEDFEEALADISYGGLLYLLSPIAISDLTIEDKHFIDIDLNGFELTIGTLVLDDSEVSFCNYNTAVASSLIINDSLELINSSSFEFSDYATASSLTVNCSSL